MNAEILSSCPILSQMAAKDNSVKGEALCHSSSVEQYIDVAGVSLGIYTDQA